MLPTANSKNSLFTYHFQQPVIYKKFLNDANNPDNLVFSSGLFGGCLFSSDITVSVLKDFENGAEPSTAAAIDDDTMEQGEEVFETMKETGETVQNEEKTIGVPGEKLKLLDVFSSYLTFLRKSVFQVNSEKRAKVITWCKGKPTVKYAEESIGAEALEEVAIHGEYMPFDRSDMVEDSECDVGYSNQYPHVWSAFENRVVGDGDASESAGTEGVLAEQVRGVEGYVERMGDVFATETGELAVQYPHVISVFETYRSVCIEAVKETYVAVEYESENYEEVELEGSATYAPTNWNNNEVFRNNYLQLEDERFDDTESLDCMSYKSFTFDDDDNPEVPSEVPVEKLDINEDTIVFPEVGGFNEIIKEKHDGGDGICWDESSKDDSKHQSVQTSNMVYQFKNYATNDVPNRVENEIFYDTHNDNIVKNVDQLPKVMLKWLGHFWGLEDDLGPPIENVSKFQHVFTPLKVAATK
ncbi:hypothetical protein GE061_001945 [Apolygus lucorum]|uniref:Uncharacterized protein n=1 Tax=Apolygus lucorum TaxID=248454 RepID=A0A6A4JGZ1_APOLU|nr:hypothetical protein GE061_001945 [Apolygus lucorum]